MNTPVADGKANAIHGQIIALTGNIENQIHSIRSGISTDLNNIHWIDKQISDNPCDKEDMASSQICPTLQKSIAVYQTNRKNIVQYLKNTDLDLRDVKVKANDYEKNADKAINL